MNANELEERLLDFGVRCTLLCRELYKLGHFDSKHVEGQLLRAGTHAGFHYPEARAAESTKDFIHKLKVMLKEEASELVAIITATVKKLDEKNKK